jgi:predicted porin
MLQCGWHNLSTFFCFSIVRAITVFYKGVNMQKKLIALAIAGLGLAASGAFAQSNVTIYGIMDASIDFTDVGDSSGTATSKSGQRTTKISSNASRIGFKGTEDMGDGMKAVFQIETAINADGTGESAGAAGTTWAGRNTFVGLEGGFGRVIAGRYDTPYKTSTRGWDLFADHLGDTRNLMGRSRASGIAFDGRPANTVRYDSPDWNGFKFAGAYIAGAEGATTSGTTKGSAWSLSASYAVNSDWSLIAAYERHKFGTAGTGGVAASGAVVGTDILADQTEKAGKLGVGYKADALRASLTYEKVSDDFNAASKHGDHKAWNLAGGYTVGSNEFKLAYTKVNDLEGVSDSGAKQWAIGVDHNMSKRTKLYAEYVKLSNDNKAAYGLTGAGANVTGGTAANVTGAPAGSVVAGDPSAWQFGVKHAF